MAPVATYPALGLSNPREQSAGGVSRHSKRAVRGARSAACSFSRVVGAGLPNSLGGRPRCAEKTISATSNCQVAISGEYTEWGGWLWRRSPPSLMCHPGERHHSIPNGRKMAPGSFPVGWSRFLSRAAKSGLPTFAGNLNPFYGTLRNTQGKPMRSASLTPSCPGPLGWINRVSTASFTADPGCTQCRP